jgi:DNA-binding CsgD family transcriptional regulator/tetratricopeptide (TPR) repeat protein
MRSDFVGRRQEMSQMTVALDEVLSGQGRVVALAGEPGIGKTRVLEELAADTEAVGAKVLWGRCPEERGAPPYWPWIQIIRSYIAGQEAETLHEEMGDGAVFIAELVAELRGKLPHLAPPPALEPEQARFRLFDAIVTFVKNASRVEPLVLILDDLHWADTSSLRLLEFCVQEIGETRSLILGAYRDVEVSPGHPLFRTLGALTRQRLFHRVPLLGLSREEVGQAIEVIGGIKPPRELVTMVHWQTEGNPLFVGEVVRLLAQQGLLVPERLHELQSWTFRLPEGIREVISRRFERFSQHTNQVLAVASVIGREFDHALLRRLHPETTEEHLLEVLDEALAAHVLQVMSGEKERYRFTHVLIQQTLYENLPASRRARIHAHVGTAMEDLYAQDIGTHAAEIAHHFGASKVITGPDKLARYAQLAGEQALGAYAWEEALLHLQRALEAMASQPMGQQKAAILSGLGRAQAAMRQFEASWTSLSQALDFYLDTCDIARAVAVAEFPLPYVPGLTGVTRQVERALALVPPESAEAGRLLSRYGRLLNLERRDYDAAQRAFAKVLAIAQREQDMALEMRACIDAADVEWHHMYWKEGLLDKSLRAVELACRLDDVYAQGWPRCLAGFALTVLGRGRDAQEHMTHAMALAEKLKDRDLFVWSSHITDLIAHNLGHWQAARESLERGLAVAPDYPNLVALRALLEYERGDINSGQVYIERLLEGVRTARPVANAEYVYAAQMVPMIARIASIPDWVNIAEVAANTILAFPSATPIYRQGARLGLALIATERSDVELAADQYRALEAQRGLCYLYIALDRVLGLLATTLRWWDRATYHFEHALDFCRQAGYLPELAWSCHDYAAMLCRRRDREDYQQAATLIDEGLPIAREVGMKPLIERLEVLRQQMIPVAHGRPRYPDGLTKREMEVLRLIATGKSNQSIADELFISLSTVAHHVSHIFNKTGVSNRVEAATYAARHQLVSL